MPPKKKKGKGKKKKSSSELTEDDKYKKSLYEIDALKDNLAFRKEFSRRTKSLYEEMKSRMDENNMQLEEIESTHKSANAYLTHQYKTLQTDLGLKIHTLESELNITKKNLDSVETELEKEIIDKKRIVEEKDERINELQRKIENLETAYDSIIHNNLDNFIKNLHAARESWETSSVSIQAKNKKLLAELGLNIHDI